MISFLDKVKKAKDIITESWIQHPDIIVGCSFGKDSMVMLHLVREAMEKKLMALNIPVFGIVANTEFQETYDFTSQIVKDWNINYKEYRFDQEVGGIDKCCGKPKVEATKLALKDVSAWISGVRKTEGITRTDFDYTDTRGGLLKVNPIVEFTELDIWRYTALNNLPINPKYREGYRSLGCALCSFPEEDENETERAGRWKGSDKACGECGIHTQFLK